MTIEILEWITPLSVGDQLSMSVEPGKPYLTRLKELLDLASSKQAKTAFSECDLLIGGTEVLVLYRTFEDIPKEPSADEIKAALREAVESC